jgi:hypothetical protein
MPDFVPRCLCNFDQNQPMLISYRSGRSSDWLKSKNPACAAVKREAEEDWGR